MNHFMISFFHSPLTMHTSLRVQEMPSPSPRDKGDHANEAKRRLKREVIHRLASGNKTHSEMAEVKTVCVETVRLFICCLSY